MVRRILSACVLLIASLCVSDASAQCSAGVFRLPGRPVARVAAAPVRLLRAVQPVRRIGSAIRSAAPLRRAGRVASAPIRWLLR